MSDHFRAAVYIIQFYLLLLHLNLKHFEPGGRRLNLHFSLVYMNSSFFAAQSCIGLFAQLNLFQSKIIKLGSQKGKSRFVLLLLTPIHTCLKSCELWQRTTLKTYRDRTKTWMFWPFRSFRLSIFLGVAADIFSNFLLWRNCRQIRREIFSLAFVSSLEIQISNRFTLSLVLLNDWEPNTYFDLIGCWASALPQIEC